MTFDEALKLENNTPILLSDGSFGLVTNWWEPDEIGVQVPGEDNTRHIKVSRIYVIHSALVELALQKS